MSQQIEDLIERVFPSKPIHLSLQSLHATFTIVAPAARANALSETEFYETYDPQKKESGDLFDFDDVKDLDPMFVWSVMETGDAEDDSWYASPGFHRVNVLGYVTSKRPCVNWDLEAVYFDAFDSGREEQLGEETIKALQEMQRTGQQFTVEFDRDSLENLIKWDTAARLEYSMRSDDDEVRKLREHFDEASARCEKAARDRLEAAETEEEKERLRQKFWEISTDLSLKANKAEATMGEAAALAMLIAGTEMAVDLIEVL